MAQDITLMGATYLAVPAVLLPTSNGTARFDDTSDANATAGDILSGKTAYVNGVKITGTATSQGVSVVETPDSHGGTVVTITGAVFLTYYTGSSAPSSSLGIDGDIYLQT